MMYDELIKNLRICSRCDFGQDCNGCTQDRDDRFCCDILLHNAADAIEDLENKLNLWRQDKIRRWIPVTERLPESETHVLAACRTLFSNCGYICDAFYAAPKSMEVSCYDACECETEYDEEEDKYFLVSGWYEVIKNWDDYDSIAIEDKVTHWMPLPQPPESAET